MKALLLRDLRLALRSGGGFGLGLAFFLIVVVLVPFGVGPEGGILGRIAPGILWVGALLACLLSLDRIFALDFEDGSLDLLATAPIPHCKPMPCRVKGMGARRPRPCSIAGQISTRYLLQVI